MSDWHDTPPTKAGTYWVKTPLGGDEPIHLAPDGSWWYADHPKAMADVDGCQFGPRIPTADELAQIDRERTALCEVATLCMNTRAIMPEFREIEDYAEVPDILGAFLERLGELPGLIDTLVLSVAGSSSCSERNEFDAANRLMNVVDDTKAKINAILGVAE